MALSTNLFITDSPGSHMWAYRSVIGQGFLILLPRRRAAAARFGRTGSVTSTAASSCGFTRLIGAETRRLPLVRHVRRSLLLCPPSGPTGARRRRERILPCVSQWGERPRKSPPFGRSNGAVRSLKPPTALGFFARFCHGAVVLSYRNLLSARALTSVSPASAAADRRDRFDALGAPDGFSIIFSRCERHDDRALGPTF